MVDEIPYSDRILHSILARDEKGKTEYVNPIVYKELYFSEYNNGAPNNAYYERLKDAVAVYQDDDITNSNGYSYGREWYLCIFYKAGYMTYSHHKRMSFLERYIYEEDVANPLRKNYNYESIKEYIEDKNISDADKIYLIYDMLKEYSKVFDKRGRWEEYYH